jgi:hypothetical protein
VLGSKLHNVCPPNGRGKKKRRRFEVVSHICNRIRVKKELEDGEVPGLRGMMEGGLTRRVGGVYEGSIRLKM